MRFPVLPVAVGAVVVLCALPQVPPRPPPAKFATIHAPCNTFVSQFSPTRTPALRRLDEGLRLVVSFTPAKDVEADRLRTAIEAGTRALIVYPNEKTVEIVGIENGDLVLAVHSEQHAREVLALLCFANSEQNAV